MGILSSISNFLSGGADKRAEGYFNDATEEMRKLKLPDIEQMKIELENMVLQGEITPEDARTYLQEQSEFSRISLDPKLKAAQMDALSSLQDISSSGGLTAMDRAQLSQIAQQEATQARGAREAILQNAQARGTGGSGLELMAQLQNAQDAATRQSNRDLGVAGLAQERALQAIMQSGQLGGQIAQQDFAQQAQRAAASDAINRFNTAARQDSSNMNTLTRNQAQAANLANRQQLENANVALRNEQQRFNRALPQQAFENQARKASGVSSGLQGQAQNQMSMGAANKDLVGSLLMAGATLAAAPAAAAVAPAAAAASPSLLGGLTFSDKNMKKDVEEFDADEFLSSLDDKKYRYKDSMDGAGTHGGVFAQDLEKTDVGRGMVRETSRGKAVDYGQASGAMLASLVELNERLKKLERGA